MNDGFDYFNLYSARNTQKNRLHQYMITDYNSKRNSSSKNNKRCSSHKNTINTFDDDGNFIIKEYGQRNKGNYLFNDIQDKSRKHKKNMMKMSSSSSNLNTIQNNLDLQQGDLLINRLHKEFIYKKNHQMYNPNYISDFTINNNKTEKKNINNNNIYSNNKLNQMNKEIYNLKKKPINKELTTKLKDNKNFYEKIMNNNLESFNLKLTELENENMFLMKQNQTLKNNFLDIKRKYNNYKNRKYSSIKIIKEINLTLNKNGKFIKIKIDENLLKMQKIIKQYESKINNLSKEINLLKSDIKNKNSQIMTVKKQYYIRQNRMNEIFNDNKIKENTIQIKDKEIENRKNEIDNLNIKINQLLTTFEKEKKEKEKIQRLYEKTTKEIENNKNEIELMKSLSLSKEIKLNNISSQSHKIIFNKNLPKYKLSWSLITVKKETEIKNYINTFWISEEDKKQINGNISFDNIDIDLDREKEMDIKDLEKNNDIKKLKNIIEEKEKIINQLKNKTIENDIISDTSLDNKDKKGFVSMDKYIKIVNQLSEAKMKINQLMSDNNNNNKNNNLNQAIKNFNVSAISEEFSDFIKNEDNGNNIRLLGDNNKINLNNSDDTNKYLEKYIDDLENKLEKIKNLVKKLIQEMEYTSNINTILYNLLIVSGYDDQEAIYIIQEKQKNIKNTNLK